jgi:hypothetical protein
MRHLVTHYHVIYATVCTANSDPATDRDTYEHSGTATADGDAYSDAHTANQYTGTDGDPDACSADAHPDTADGDAHASD